MGDQMGEGIEEWVGAGGRGHHQRHGEQHGDGAGEEGEEGAEPEVGGLHAVMVVAVVVVGFAWSGGQGGVVAGVADGGDERVGVDGRVVVICAVCAMRLTLAEVTPGTASSAFWTWIWQDAQVMP